LSNKGEYLAELIDIFKQELVECKVQPGEGVCLFTDPTTNPDYPAAFFGAAKQLGADVFEVTVPYFTRTEKKVARGFDEAVIPRKGVFQAMKAADLVIDMSTTGWLYTQAHNEILDGGTRTLRVREPVNVLKRLLPHPDVRRRTVEGAKVLEAGKTLRMTNAAGTDLTFSIEGRKGSFQYGASDIPGRWDHWPSGQVASAPVEGTCRGTLVLNRGDIILRIYRYVVDKVVCQIEDGRIVKIEGGLEGYLLDAYMSAWEDEKAFIPSHVGWGVEHRAIWHQLAVPGEGGLMDAESYYGDILLGFGCNHYRGLGGKNVTTAHIDLCLRDCSLWVDSLQVLKDGVIVPAHLK
jgi:2,5-dihydroxypyridine 5,6-dioxygenase